MVYFVQSDTDGPIKIGFTRNVEERLWYLRRHHPLPLRLLALIEGAHADEQRLHRRFDSDRLRGEWFRPSDDLLCFIATLSHEGANLAATGDVGVRMGDAGNRFRDYREVSFREACAFYKLSDKTLRKRIREGMIPARMRPMNGREEWVVQIPPGAPATPGNGYRDEEEEQARDSVPGLPGGPVRGGGEAGAQVHGSTDTPGRELPGSPSIPFPTRDDILALIREQYAAERAEKEQLRQENVKLARHVGSLEEQLRDQTRALSAGQEQTREEVTALARAVGEIDTRERVLARQGRAVMLLCVLLSLVAAALSGMLLTRSATPTVPARESVRGSAPATPRGGPKPGATRPTKPAAGASKGPPGSTTAGGR